ncbi:hypothetical protein B0T10DRAFT_557695 [Thelonectria olida]|uniref:Uncharacterized protein n=1 Tax=Thelonectria olida TaxID=1576542 RepID=A0A9P8WCC2_9HYPO|nr:hypothetical protein B0T10DRAFT_557695 [Thelonectria olida]
MASTESSAIPLAELHANWQQTVQDEPSPLRIVKQGDTHGREETTGCKSTSTDDVTRLEPRFRPQAEMHTALKHMRPEGIRKAAGKENFAVDGKFSLSHAPEADPLRAMQDVERWARDDSPPQPCRRLGLSGALTGGPSSAATFSAGYGIRRAPKARPPLSNLRDTCADSIQPFTLDHRECSLGLPPPMEGMKVLERPGPAYVLAPHVEVTSGVAALDAGQHTWWVAIEVSGRPSPIAGGVSNLGVREWSRTRMGRCSGLEQEGQFEFGSLYDLSVEVLPTGNSSILQVLQEQSFPVTLSIGSMVLILAQVRIDIKQTPKMRKSRPARARETSEDLIEDIAAELGDCEVGGQE